MHWPAQIRIPATYMRGGTSKGVFFNLADLPEQAQYQGKARDALLLRIIGSPDPYAKHTDGMGGATSSTSKAVIVSKSAREGFDVDYLFGQVAIDKPLIDWSGNCGNLTAAVGAFAIHQGLVEPDRVPQNGHVTVRIWQQNIAKAILVQIPVCNGQVQECGDFELDGVAYPAAEIRVEFIDPADGEGALFPSGNLTDTLTVPGLGTVNATLINAGIPTIFVDAEALGFSGCELQGDINSNADALKTLEALRAAGAVKMGLISDAAQAANRQHTPKVAFVAAPKNYVSSSGKPIDAGSIDLLVRAMSMGQLHHAMMGTAAVAIAVAAAIPGTIVNLAAGGGARDSVVFGHPSGTLKVGAAASRDNGVWRVSKAIMSRSARILMSGAVHVPADSLCQAST
ncbi:2-methylaconitate cis-trans isomerase PrpF [Alteromonas aestuariivivens]|uniref:2-methylaconitate cis-trans isomerase PrpF n=1 Tax=Alteromonas aestuariivivens TaxID=1938339 RepID=A0A3D8MEK9_9ALTE|nr:2-methylaconitate cis-trans isomerase PrpF [Alteromonas aestuariivivens]RDV28991.1 2-methylaconitate cis-trans isomerase PrpF [Alteromonas aestuariivivens]